MKRLLALAAIALGAGCAGGSPPAPEGVLLPSECVPGEASATATVTFVAQGRAWALDPDGATPVCLFEVDDPGPFAWGPQGDRALLASFDVRYLSGETGRVPNVPDPGALSWGRPTGKSIVFVGRGGRALLKLHPTTGEVEDVTPLAGVVYESVVYHPSGLAFAFVIEVDGRNEIWISTNLGQKPRLLVHGRLHTQIDAIAFGDRGQSLYFAARHDDWTHMHQLLLAEPTDAPTAWQGEGSEAVSDLLPLDPQRAETRLAFTVGTSCTSRRAVVRGVEALPGQRPSRAIGWLDRGQRARLLVGVGGCGRPLDLYAVDSITRRATLLVRNVDAASTRLAESEPPPPLPEQMEEEGSGFA